jgi:CubicO group peptidase (beta-lactamase class C family)/D-alanyl-D-alanine dipeptidase
MSRSRRLAAPAITPRPPVIVALAVTAAGILAAALSGCAEPRSAPTDIPPRSDYAEVVSRLSRFIEHEMADKELPALSIALVEGPETVWAAGFGYADPVERIPASAATIYRVGSVSKLFTDLAVMQLVERGELDLDAPVTDYLPDFQPTSRFEGSPTIRQLTSHRSGLVREPPVGHYFDDTTPTLARTVASLNGTTLVYEPETRRKYSNAGIAVVGYVLETTRETPFAEYLKDAVLEPLGMDHSSFEPKPAIQEGLARAYMWGYDGRSFEAPTFQLGMSPAGSLYASVADLGKFMSALFAGGVGERGQLVSAETLEEMFTPQFAPADATTGSGIGFAVGSIEGRRSVGHGGAIYGFATDLIALPDEQLGAVSVTNMDVANTVVSRINNYALRLMLAAREGSPLPEPIVTEPVPADIAARISGTFATANGTLEMRIVDRGVARGDPGGELYAYLLGGKYRVRARGDTLVLDDRVGFGGFFRVDDGTLVARDGTRLERLPEEARPESSPARFAGLIGEYGWDYNTLFIYEDGNQLHALIEWIEIDPLTEVSADTFAFPNSGLYHGERLVFQRGPDGIATAVEAAGVLFTRREAGGEGDDTFTIRPIRPVDELRREALAATPPVEEGPFREPDLVEVQDLDPSIRYDIRYATTNNFMQDVFYASAHAYLQRPAAEALVRAQRRLAEDGYGLLIHDAYRPWHVTKMFWDATPEAGKIFVADPGNGSRHNRGAAVDLTLYDLATGEPVLMVGGYDEMSERSFPDYTGGTSLQRWHRELLRSAMEEQGFRVYEYEWWHFDYQDWAEYPILNLTFEELQAPVAP